MKYISIEEAVSYCKKHLQKLRAELEDDIQFWKNKWREALKENRDLRSYTEELEEKNKELILQNKNLQRELDSYKALFKEQYMKIEKALKNPYITVLEKPVIVEKEVIKKVEIPVIKEVVVEKEDGSFKQLLKEKLKSRKERLDVKA